MKVKDICRPIWGTLSLQPLCIYWAYLNDVNYFNLLGIFTIVCTVYLIPSYELYEKMWEWKNG